MHHNWCKVMSESGQRSWAMLAEHRRMLLSPPSPQCCHRWLPDPCNISQAHVILAGSQRYPSVSIPWSIFYPSKTDLQRQESSLLLGDSIFTTTGGTAEDSHSLHEAQPAPLCLLLSSFSIHPLNKTKAAAMSSISFPKEEEAIIQRWRDIKAFETQVKLSEGRENYTFYDGPPFATGLPYVPISASSRACQ